MTFLHELKLAVRSLSRVKGLIYIRQDALNRRLMWTDGVMQFIGIATEPRRIVGVVADIDDEHITPSPTMTVYRPFEQEIAAAPRVRACDR